MRTDLSLFPVVASSFAGEVDALYCFLLLLTFVITLGIAGAILFFLVRYRRRTFSEVGADIAGNDLLEATWIVIPFLISIGIFYWGADLYFRIYRAPRDGLEVHVIGKQWMWKFQHEGGQRELNQLHVPVNRNVRLLLSSEDVIHSFFVPAFRLKADVLPGRYRTLWFRATRTGTYRLHCAEYCGTSHSAMGGSVIVMEPDAYQTWLAEGSGDGSAASRGEKLFLTLGCSSCHSADMPGRGPRLNGLYGRPTLLDDGQIITADEDYLRESIVNPAAKIAAGFQPIMPTFQGVVTEENLLDLIAYIKSLAPAPAANHRDSAP